MKKAQLSLLVSCLPIGFGTGISQLVHFANLLQTVRSDSSQIVSHGSVCYVLNNLICEAYNCLIKVFLGLFKFNFVAVVVLWLFGILSLCIVMFCNTSIKVFCCCVGVTKLHSHQHSFSIASHSTLSLH